MPLSGFRIWWGNTPWGFESPIRASLFSGLRTPPSLERLEDRTRLAETCVPEALHSQRNASTGSRRDACRAGR